MSFRLSIDDGHFARTLEVRERLLTVGTASGCGLRLASEGVTRRHATLRMCGRSVVIEDLGGRSGVHVGGRRVRRAALRVGDEVRLGRARLRLMDVLPEPRRRAAGPQAGGGPSGDTGTKSGAGTAGAADVLPPRRDPLRRRAASAFAVSVLLHAAVLTALWTWTLADAAIRSSPAQIDVASLDATAEIDQTPDTLPVVDPADLIRREEDTPELIPLDDELPDTPLLDDDPRFRPPPKDAQAPLVPVTSRPEPADTPTVIGIGGGATEDHDLGNRGFGKGDAARGNRIAAGLLDSDSGAGGAALRAVRARAAASTVWVLRGDYDQAEKTFAELGIDHDLLGKDDLETRDIPASVRVLVYNCTGRPLSPEAQARVGAWVRGGGWLVSTDWGVERLLQHGLPDTLTPLRTGDRPVLTKDETVGVRATTAQGLGAGLPQEGSARWWLEDSSVPFTVATGIGAEVLVRSDDLERRHGHDASAVAVTFPFGRGRVLHLLGHLYQQEGNVRGAMLVHRLVVNTLAAALR